MGMPQDTDLQQEVPSSDLRCSLKDTLPRGLGHGTHCMHPC